MQKYKIEIKWALIFVAVSLVWMGLERAAGLHSVHIDKHAIYTNLFALPAIGVYVLALLDKRQNYYQGSMNYKQGFMTGLWITVIITVLTPLTQYLIAALISPEYFTNAIAYAVMEEKMTQAAAENYFSLRSYIIQGLIGAPVMGLVTTAILALFTKRGSS